MVKNERKREGAKSFSLRSTEFCQSEFVEPRTKVHCIDKGYAHVQKMRGFTEDPKEEIWGNRGFRAWKASYPSSTVKE